MSAEENNAVASGEEAALAALESEMGVDYMVLMIFYMTYEKAVGKSSGDDDDITLEDVEGFKQYLLGGGENWKTLIQGSLRAFYNMSENGVKFMLDDGSALDENGFTERCNQVKSWIERNGGETKYSGCYVATAVYGSYDCPQVWTLRRFRDQVLQTNSFGRAFIKVYYAISPALVRLFGKTSWFTGLTKPMLDRFVLGLNRKGISDGSYVD
jgi:hypothetical protein